MKGWIKLHRKVMENPIFNDPALFRLWCMCLMKAAHKEREILVGSQVVTIQPGEFVTGRNSLEEEYNRGVKPKDRVPGITLWRWLNSLEKLGNVNIKKTNKYSVVSIVNWDLYQQDEQQMNNKRTTDEQQMNTNKNDKELKELQEIKDPLLQQQERALEFLVGEYEKNKFSPVDDEGNILPYLKKEIFTWLTNGSFDEPEEIIQMALEEALLSNGREWRLVKTILERWKSDQLRTVEDIQRDHEEFRKSKEQKVVPIRKGERDGKHKGLSSQSKFANARSDW